MVLPLQSWQLRYSEQAVVYPDPNGRFHEVFWEMNGMYGGKRNDGKEENERGMISLP